MGQISGYTRGEWQHSLCPSWSWRAIVLAWLVGLGGCATLERNYEAVLVLADIAAGNGPSRLKSVTPAPSRREISYSIDGRAYLADLYQSGDQPLAALVLIHGLAEQGKADPRLRAFAETLARARFTVLVPDMVSLRHQQIGSEDVQDIADAVAFLVRHPDWAPGGWAGIGAFSFAVGPAILAGLQPDTGQQVSFILGVGGYYDLIETLTYVLTGYFYVDGKRRYSEPNRYGKWIVLLSYLDHIDDPKDRELLEKIARQKLADLDAVVEDFASQLGPQGRAVYDFVTNKDPQRVEELLTQLPREVVKEVRALDLASKDLSELKAQAILVHGRDDTVIPYNQSIALAEALPADQVRLFLVDGLYHVDIDPGLTDYWRLWRATVALLSTRVRPPP